MTCLGKGATGLTSPSGSEMSAFLISLRRYPVRNKEQSFLRHTNSLTVQAKSNSQTFSSLNLIITGLVNQRLHFIQLNLQPADISHDCSFRFNETALCALVYSCFASTVPSQLCFDPVWRLNRFISCSRLGYNYNSMTRLGALLADCILKISVCLPRILSISSHFLISLTCFLWNALTLGLSWNEKVWETQSVEWLTILTPPLITERVWNKQISSGQTVINHFAECFWRLADSAVQLSNWDITVFQDFLSGLTSLNSTSPSSPSSLMQSYAEPDCRNSWARHISSPRSREHILTVRSDTSQLSRRG